MYLSRYDRPYPAWGTVFVTIRVQAVTGMSTLRCARIIRMNRMPYQVTAKGPTSGRPTLMGGVGNVQMFKNADVAHQQEQWHYQRKHGRQPVRHWHQRCAHEHHGEYQSAPGAVPDPVIGHLLPWENKNPLICHQIGI